MSVVISKDVEIEVDLLDCSDQDLIEELEDRGYCIVPNSPKSLGRATSSGLNPIFDQLIKMGYPPSFINVLKDWQQAPWGMPQSEIEEALKRGSP